MLELAIKAGIPIITARTSDIHAHVMEVLTDILVGGPPLQWVSKVGEQVASDKVYLAFGDVPNTAKIYQILVEKGSTLIIVNPSEKVYEGFDIGEIETPHNIIKDRLVATIGPAAAVKVQPYCRGLNIKQLMEVVRLASARFGDITPVSVQAIRREIGGTTLGLTEILGSTFYVPPTFLEEWATLNKPFFMDGTYGNLTPRGLLFSGHTGTGKSQGAKFLANRWGIPLFHVNIGSTMDKWHGASEANFARILREADGQEPCALLFDEVDRMFGKADDNGVTSRILGDWLYWLQEHKTRVLTIMTTNHVESLPDELYREGRVDEVMTFERMGLKEAVALASISLTDYSIGQNSKKQLSADVVSGIKSALSKTDKRIAQVQVIQIVRNAVKQYLSTKMKEQP